MIEQCELERLKAKIYGEYMQSVLDSVRELKSLRVVGSGTRVGEVALTIGNATRVGRS